MSARNLDTDGPLLRAAQLQPLLAVQGLPAQALPTAPLPEAEILGSDLDESRFIVSYSLPIW